MGMKEMAEKWGPLKGRVFIALIFLLAGVNKIMDFSGSQEYMAAKGMPMTGLLLAGAIVFLIAGSLSVMLGYKARWGALLLIIFLIPATLIFHISPWETEMMSFIKNLGLLGGLIYVYTYGSGPFSLKE